MPKKKLAFDEAARNSLKKGIAIVAEAVGTTMGPKGRAVAIGQKYGRPTVTHDGVSVAKEIELKDRFENMGAQLLKEAASKTKDVAGDGTTAATVLVRAMVLEGLRNVAAGANPMLLKQGIDKATDAAVSAVRASATPVNTREEMAQVATIAAADGEIGTLIGEVMAHVGKDGVVTIEEGKGMAFEVEYVDGTRIDKGYISSYFITDLERSEAVVEGPYILITDRKISATDDIVPIMEKVVQSRKRALAVIAEDVDGQALGTLVANKLRGVVSCVAAKAPSFGDRRKDMLQDIAILTGGQFIAEATGRKLQEVTLKDLGRAKKVVATKDDTTIIGGMGSPKAIQSRIKEIRVLHEKETSNYEREKLEERLAKMAGGVAVIKVGAATELEMKEKKQRVEGALSATKAAVAEGVVPGGGVTLLNAASALDQLNLSGDVATGAAIVRRALEEPMRQLAHNAGQEGSVVVHHVRQAQQEQGDTHVGYDVMVGDYGDMVKKGIVDPAKVTLAALQSAASVASMILTTDTLVSEIPKPPPPPPMRPGYPPY